MATVKIACPKCGQKVSGDESFFGTTVTCPVCTSDIHFPPVEGEAEPPRESSSPSPEAKALSEEKPFRPEAPVPPRSETSSHPPAASPEAPPKGEFSHLPPSPHQVPLDGPEADGPKSDRRSRWEEDDDEEVPSPLFGAISLVSSILGVVTCVGGILFAPLAIIFGHTALARAKHSPVKPAPGQTLAVVGVIIGYIYLIFIIVALVAAVLFNEQLRALLNPVVE